MRLEALFRPTACALNLVGADLVLGHRYRGTGSIFVFHSVVHKREDYLFDSLRTNASFLEAIIRHYRGKGVDIVSLGEAMDRLATRSNRPFVCFTFDDGYRDNMTVALPIFERYSAPLTIFVTTCLVNGTMHNWWTGLIELIKTRDRIKVDMLECELDLSTFEQKVAAYRMLSRAVGERAADSQDLQHLFQTYSISLPRLLDSDALSETDLQALSLNPLVEIGAHTENHPHLKELPENQAKLEIVSNKRWLEELIQKKVSHFAYPYGGPKSCGPREFAIAAEVGFRTAVTTRVGNLVHDHASQSTALPRLRSFSDYESIRLLEFQRNGAASALASGFGDAVITA
jgi:peptidoglycan/xylan/chitin deacetylase (PgdA/CDA1 family)